MPMAQHKKGNETSFQCGYNGVTNFVQIACNPFTKAANCIHDEDLTGSKSWKKKTISSAHAVKQDPPAYSSWTLALR